MAAEWGHLDCLMKWTLVQTKCYNSISLDSETCYYAAKGGHLDCLIWARENGGDWDSTICEAASEGGHLDCLIWARENGCDWSKDQCRILASINYHQAILDWINLEI